MKKIGLIIRKKGCKRKSDDSSGLTEEAIVTYVYKIKTKLSLIQKSRLNFIYSLNPSHVVILMYTACLGEMDFISLKLSFRSSISNYVYLVTCILFS